jgi:hypothetical protein
MASYVFGPESSGLNMAVAASRRWAKEGYTQGAFYDAWSAFAAIEYELNDKNAVFLTAIAATNRRGRAAPLTQEVAEILSPRYNPYWGFQENSIRNSRERRIYEPIIQAGFRHESQKLSLRLGISYQAGSQGNSRLGYYNAPNPDPVYYRYLPSYSVNNPSGANFTNAALAREALILKPQLNWSRLYRANSQNSEVGKAAYLLYDDRANRQQLTIQALGNLDFGQLKLDMGLGFRQLRTDHYGLITDLLGAEYHDDIDPFSSTRNDLEGLLQKKVGDAFGYKYQTTADLLNPFLQMAYTGASYKVSAAVEYKTAAYQRVGIFANGRYPQNSKGTGEPIRFGTVNFKGGIRYHLGGRHWWDLNALYGRRPPLLKHAFVNPRENHLIVPGLKTEKVSAVDFNYDLRLPDLTARLGGFYSRMMDITDIRFFYTDSGLGSEFVQEVVRDLDLLNMGLELGLEWNLTSSLSANLVASVGKFRYASDPLISINFDTAGPEEDLINTEGYTDLGPSMVKGLHMSTGPQHAFSVGLEYRDPDYWRLGISANYLNERYIQPSFLTRTGSFRLNPDTGQAFPGATKSSVAKLLIQESLPPLYLLNMTAGKSWLSRGAYIGLFASINNLFDTSFVTGGFEQSRNGNYGQWIRDHQSGLPSFGPKYWYGQGRTFFLNLSISF